MSQFETIHQSEPWVFEQLRKARLGTEPMQFGRFLSTDSRRSGRSLAGESSQYLRGAIGLVLARRFEPGTLLEVEIQLASQGFYRPILVQVLHVSAYAQGGWFIGGSSPKQLSDHDLITLLTLEKNS